MNTVMRYLAIDDRISVYHIALYQTIFQVWNNAGFRNPLSLHRDEVMIQSKIGSRGTYSKALKDLSNFGYLYYMPSFNPMIASKVYMFSFCTGLGQVMGSYINYINYLNLNIKGIEVWKNNSNANKNGSYSRATCSYLEQVLDRLHADLLRQYSHLLDNSNHIKPKRKYASKPNLHPTGHQPTPDADYSEPL